MNDIIRKILGKPPKWAFDAILPFGKYKGESVGDILAVDPNYLDWFKDLITVNDYLRTAIETALEAKK